MRITCLRQTLSLARLLRQLGMEKAGFNLSTSILAGLWEAQHNSALFRKIHQSDRFSSVSCRSWFCATCNFSLSEAYSSAYIISVPARRFSHADLARI
jgi:hypothetical protein